MSLTKRHSPFRLLGDMEEIYTAAGFDVYKAA